jgi:hypothetical protein
MKTLKRFLLSVIIGLCVLVPSFSQSTGVELFNGLYAGMTKDEAYPIAMSLFNFQWASIAKFGYFYAGKYKFEFGQRNWMDVSQIMPGYYPPFAKITSLQNFDMVHYMRGRGTTLAELFYLEDALVAVRIYDTDSASTIRAALNRYYGRTSSIRYTFSESRSQIQVESWISNRVLISLVDISSASIGIVDFVDLSLITNMEATVPGDYLRLSDQ